MTTLPHPTTETLYDLWGRLKKRSRSDKTNDEVTQSPSTAAREFVSSQTGISFIDAALSLCHDPITSAAAATSTSKNADVITKPIVIDISGDTSTGKSSTIVTLAARYLFATRHFQNNNKDVVDSDNDNDAVNRKQQKCLSDQTNNETLLFPLVILFDVNRNVTNCARRVYDVLYSMMQQESCERNGDKENHHQTAVNGKDDACVHDEVMECLQRLHVARVDDFPQWVLLLETLRHELSYQHQQQQQQQPTTLLLWDDFLDEVIVTTTTTTLAAHGRSNSSSHNHSTYHRSTRAEITAIRMDVIRQVERLLHECPKNTILVTTSSSSTLTTSITTSSYYGGGPKNHQRRIIGKEWNRFVSISIHLERCRNRPMVAMSSNGNEGMTLKKNCTSQNGSIMLDPNNDTSISTTTSKASQYSDNAYLGLATITTTSASNNNGAQQQQQHQHQIPFSISLLMNGMVS